MLASLVHREYYRKKKKTSITCYKSLSFLPLPHFFHLAVMGKQSTSNRKKSSRSGKKRREAAVEYEDVVVDCRRLGKKVTRSVPVCPSPSPRKNRLAVASSSKTLLSEHSQAIPFAMPDTDNTVSMMDWLSGEDEAEVFDSPSKQKKSKPGKVKTVSKVVMNTITDYTWFRHKTTSFLTGCLFVSSICQKYSRSKLLPLITNVKTVKSDVSSIDAKIVSHGPHYVDHVVYSAIAIFPSTKLNSGMKNALFHRTSKTLDWFFILVMVENHALLILAITGMIWRSTLNGKLR